MTCFRWMIVAPWLAMAAPALALDCGPPTTRAAQAEHLARMEGFARQAGTSGGLGQQVYLFDSLEDGGSARHAPPGTLRAAVEAARRAGGGWVMPSPRIPRGAEIRLEAPLRLPSNITLDGGCQGVKLVGPGRSGIFLVIGNTNVVITRWHLHMPAENVESSRPGDCIGIGGGADRVWLAFNRLGRCGDGQIDITQSVTLPIPTRVTVAFNHFTNHDKVMLLATLDCGQRVRPANAVCPNPLTPDWDWATGVQVTLQGNLFDETGQRHPRVSGRVYVHMLDNLVAYKPFRREGGSLGPGYGVFVGGGGRLLLDHGIFWPTVPGAGWAARVQNSASEGAGAIRVTGALAPAPLELRDVTPEMVPAPPYELRGSWAPQPGAEQVEVMRRCTGPGGMDHPCPAGAARRP